MKKNLPDTDFRREVRDASKAFLELNYFIPYADESAETIHDLLINSSEVKKHPVLGKASPEQFPVPKTIRRWKQEYIGIDKKHEAGAEHYEWPDSHEAGLVPWEAGEIGLQLVSYISGRGGEFLRGNPLGTLNPTGANKIEYLHPTVAQVRHAYHLTLTFPDMPLLEPNNNHPMDSQAYVLNISRLMAITEITNMGQLFNNYTQGDIVPYIDWLRDYLAWTPWRSREHAKAYEDKSTVQHKGPHTLVVVPLQGSQYKAYMRQAGLAEGNYREGFEPTSVAYPLRPRIAVLANPTWNKTIDPPVLEDEQDAQVLSVEEIVQRWNDRFNPDAVGNPPENIIMEQVREFDDLGEVNTYIESLDETGELGKVINEKTSEVYRAMHDHPKSNAMYNDEMWLASVLKLHAVLINTYERGQAVDELEIDLDEFIDWVVGAYQRDQRGVSDGE